MKNRLLGTALVAVTILSLLASAYAGWQRHMREKNYKSVEMVVVYNEVRDIAQAQGINNVEALAMFRDRGATAVLVKEPDLNEVIETGEFAVVKGSEIVLGRTGYDLDPLAFQGYEVNPKDTILISSSEKSFQRVAKQFTAKNIPYQAINSDGRYMIITTYPYRWLADRGIGFGFPQEYIDDILQAGLRPMVQLRTWPAPTEEGVRQVFAGIREIPGLGPILFNDPKLPGSLPILAEEIKKLDVPLAQVEFFNQTGLNSLGLLLDKNVVRLHSIPTKEAGNYSPGTAADRFLLAATERNMRVLLFHDLSPQYADAMEYNLGLIERVRDGLVQEGFSLGQPSVFAPMAVSRLLLFVIGLGVITGGMLLLNLLGLQRFVVPLGLLGLIIWTGMLGAGMVNPARKLMALGAMIIYPTVAILLSLKDSGASIGRVVLIFLRMSLISFAGALLAVGLLTDIGFMLKLDQFAGVKLAHLLPLLALAVFYFFSSGTRETWVSRVKRLADQPLTVGLVILGMVVGLAGLLYLIRTGNDAGAAVTALELKFRALLGDLLQVRPRTKEFALGHPLMLFLLYLGYRDNRMLPILLGGVIGQISLVNTYAHIHTPLVISLIRSFNGLWLGILVGIALIFAWKMGEKFIRKYAD